VPLRLPIFIICFAFTLLSSNVNSAETPSAQQKQPSSSKSKTPDGNTQPQKSPTPVIQQGTPEATERHSYQIENYNYNPDKGWDWPAIVEAISTLGLLSFAGWQMHFITRSTRATEIAARASESNAASVEKTIKFIETQAKAAADQAEAAKSSAETTRTALRVDRPYLLLEKAILSGVWRRNTMGEFTDKLTDEDKFEPVATFYFRNCGKGPVIFHKILIRLIAANELPKLKNFTDCREIDIRTEVLPIGESYEVESSWWDTWDFKNTKAAKATLDESKTLIVYGCVYYRDVVDNLYETGFLWRFKPESLIKPGDFELTVPASFHRGPREYNYST
jgi:hypothetical protein